MYTINNFKLLLSFLFLVFLVACQNSGSSNEGEGEQDDMAQFADDPEFQAKHRGPTPSSPEGIGEMIRYATPDGADAGAYALMKEGSNKFLIVIHEWWGLNDNIKSEAERYFKELGDVNVLAIDVYDGKVATDPETAGKYMQGIDMARAQAIVQGAIDQAGDDAKIATVGWCFGGGWSLRTSIMAEEKATACVIYYGMPVQTVEEIEPLQADVLGIFGAQDGWINPDVVAKFELLAKEAGKSVVTYSYNADHAFANPSNPNYVEVAAQQANELALEFIRTRL